MPPRGVYRVYYDYDFSLSESDDTYNRDREEFKMGYNSENFDTEIFSKRRKIYSICVEGNERNGRNGRNKQPNFRSSFSLGSNLTTFAFFAVFAVSKLDQLIIVT